MQRGLFPPCCEVKPLGHIENPGTAHWQWVLEINSGVMTTEEPLIITNNFTQEFFKGSKVEKGNNKQLGW